MSDSCSREKKGIEKMGILKLETLDQEIKDFHEILNHGTDIACVLIGTNFLDVSLHDVLSLSFKKGETTKRILNHNSGFLGTFRSRTELCYCMSLIDKKIFQDLIKISEIRNEVAHSHILKVFDNENVIRKCDELSYWKIFNTGFLKKLFDSDFKETSRNKFVFSTLIISQMLLLKIKIFKKEQNV
jgi:DNA-binding MltR family transcriptional regulator